MLRRRRTTSSITNRCSATPTTINALLQPDVVVLDEAQRIKNWQTKTARQVKSLRSRRAFVLTGTPVENRIDELYSIVQFLDPEIFGPLFRFNRDFYELDERGRPIDYKNLAMLRERAAPVMLRRRKADVEKELPGRTVKTYFVAMADEQRARYEDYRLPAARLIAIATKAPAAQGRVRPAPNAARLHAHGLRHAGDPRSRLSHQSQARRIGKNPRRSPGRPGSQDHRVL